MSKRCFEVSVVAICAVTVFCLGTFGNAQDKAKSPKPKALKRTRDQVRMLDDIYKNGIVLITTHYVNDESDLPAGTAFKKLFAAAKAKGWHEVRLLDATGDPYNDENAPKDDFERTAIRHLKEGKSYYEQVIEKDGKYYLRAVTPVPVVMEKCVMCHDNYADVKKGEPIGALGYTVPIK